MIRLPETYTVFDAAGREVLWPHNTQRTSDRASTWIKVVARIEVAMQIGVAAHIGVFA
jgi:hypothetical protein